MPKVCSISVPHTGTWFLINLFKELGMEDNNLVPSRIRDNVIYHGHSLKGTQVDAAVRLARQMPIVVPLRHPYRVEESWKRRNKPVKEMIECFDVFIDRILPLEPYILPVDSVYREDCLNAMAEGLNMPLRADFGQVVNGKQGTHDVSLDDLEPSLPVIQLARRVEPLLSRYYP